MKKYQRLLFILLLVWCDSGYAADLPPFDGLIEPREVVDFSSQIPGIIEKISVERGDWVKKGQILATLQSGVERAAVDLARARVDFAQRRFVRNQQLFEKKLISSHDQDELETEIQLGKLAVIDAEERLKLRTIRSTINGVVTRRMGAPGEYVGEEPFVTVAQVHPLSVELVIPDKYYGAIKEGDLASVVLHLPKTQELEAKVSIVDDVIDAASSTFGVRLELPNPKLKIPAGVKCKVVFK